MDPDASLHNSHIDATPLKDHSGNVSAQEEVQTERFKADWNPDDATSLGPSNLPLSRPLRAYERAPKSPFARKRVRFGKVWKRPTSTARIANVGAGDESPAPEPVTKRFRARVTSLQSPMKAVKKLCVSSDYGLAPQVLSWEPRGSPARKIVTRSNAIADELEALLDEEEALDGNEIVDMKVEIVDEAGNTILDEDDREDSGDWEDESYEEPAPLEDTLMHLGEAVDHANATLGDSVDGEDAASSSSTSRATEALHSKLPSPTGAMKTDTGAAVRSETVEASVGEPADQQPTLQQQGTPKRLKSILKSTPVVELAPLPDGFVSPAVRRASVRQRMTSSATDKRRRTLPVDFASAFEVGSGNHGTVPVALQMADRTNLESHFTVSDVKQDNNASDTRNTAMSLLHTSSNAAMQPSVEDDWEDVDEDDSIAQTCGVGDESLLLTEDVEQSPGETIVGVVRQRGAEHDEQTAGQSTGAPEVANSQTAGDDELTDETRPGETSASDESEVERSPASSGRIPESPEILKATLTQPYPLPVRRSPRRKSSSPLKPKAAPQNTGLPHFLAFTPIKNATHLRQAFTMLSDEHTQDATADQDVQGDSPDVLAPLERSASAPPEEPVYQSPKRQPRPRVSDDTALLQAFLSRAAERKTSGRMSTAKRESFENRRESNAVREALASSQVSPPESRPTEGILGEMDPNSPLPRKKLPVEQDAAKKSNIKQISIPESDFADECTRDQQADGKQSQAKTPRRSARDKRRAQAGHDKPTSTSAGPNKITLRTNADAVVVKRTEAQELAMLTRTNTYKNKSGSVMPLQRLIKLAGGEKPVEMEGVEGVTFEDIEERDGRVRWKETLAEYCEAPTEPGSELLELGNNGAVVTQTEGVSADSMDSEPVEHAKVPAPCDTPSKPRIRRLRAPKTAGTPAKARSSAPPPSIEDEKRQSKQDSVSEEKSNTKAPTAKKRSRIATPAKKQLDIAPSPVAESTVPAFAQYVELQQKPAPALVSTNAAAPSSTRRKAPVSRLPAPGKLSTIAGQGKEKSQSHSITPNLASPPKKKIAPAVASAGKGLAAAPKLDLGTSAKLQSRQETATEEDVPGLKSPAKKGAVSKRIFTGGDSDMAGGGTGLGYSEGQSLFSPAKKRSARRIGV